MRSAKGTGRLVGGLFLLQLAGLIVPFIMLLPIARTDFLSNAAASAFQIKLAVLLLLANAVITIGITAAVLPVFRQHNLTLALWLLVSAIVWLALQAVDNGHIRSLLALSEEYAAAGTVNSDLFPPLAAAVRSTRLSVHFTELLVIDGWMFMFYGLLWRSAIVPRLLAAFGLLTVTLHTIGISLPLLLGYGGVTLMGATMAVSNVATAGWLMLKGFRNGGQEEI